MLVLIKELKVQLPFDGLHPSLNTLYIAAHVHVSVSGGRCAIFNRFLILSILFLVPCTFFYRFYAVLYGSACTARV